MVTRCGADPRAGLGDAEPVHEERGAAAPRACRGGRVGAYAQRFGEDEELWRATALLHDFDYEMHPTLDKHPQDGAPILREEGWPEEVVDGVLSHASHLGLPRDTPLKKTLFACDELAGFIHACGLVRPDGIATLEPKSVQEEAEAAVLRRGRQPAGRLRGRRGARRRAGRPHPLRHRGDASDRGRARPTAERRLAAPGLPRSSTSRTRPGSTARRARCGRRRLPRRAAARPRPGHPRR